MSNFRTIDRQTGFLLPPSVNDWLPEKHLARFVVEVIEGSGRVGDEQRLSRLGVGELSSSAVAWHFDLRLRHGRFFQPQAGAGDV